MTEKIWLGAIFLKDEGGYKIIIKSLEYYKKRLKTIGNSPGLKDSSAMFALLLQQEATKEIPKIDQIMRKIQDNLSDTRLLSSLKDEVSFLTKALVCYEADIQKAQDTGDEYYMKLIGDIQLVKDDIEIIRHALNKINQFSV